MHLCVSASGLQCELEAPEEINGWGFGDAHALDSSISRTDFTGNRTNGYGDAPVKGYDAIRDGWFNPDYAPTVVRESVREPAEIFVSGNIGVVRGRSRLVWEYEGIRTAVPEANYVMIAVRRDQGWRIRLLTWNDDPRIWLREVID